MNQTIFALIAMLVVMLYIPSAHAVLDNTASISLSLINQDPDPAITGDTVEVRIGIQNIGGNAVEGLTMELVPSYPFTLLSDESGVQEIGTIQGYQGYYETSSMKTVKYTVMIDKDAIAGSYNLKIKYYGDGLGNAVEKSIPIDISSRQSAEIIHIDKTTLVPGHQSSLKFSINNVGNAPLRDLTFSWENDEGIILPVGSDNTRYIKYIDVGESAEIEYQVIADTNADAGLYKLDLYLNYENSLNSSTSRMSTIAGIYVGGGTDFDITYSESSGTDISFTIANIGSNPATSVSIIIPEQSRWKTTGASSTIIGNLDTGDYTVATFTLQSTQAQTGFTPGQGYTRPGQQRNLTQGATVPQVNNTQSQSNLKVQIAYTDTMGTRQLVEKQVSMSQSSSSGNSTSTTAGFTAGGTNFRFQRQESFLSKYKWYIAGLVVLVIVGSVFIKYRKEKLLNPSYKLKDVFRKRDKAQKEVFAARKR